MPKVGIIYDRMRSEEKMLKQATIDLGCDVSLVDAKDISFNTDSKSDSYDLGDIILERCVSYFRGLHFTSMLNFMNLPVINDFRTAQNCGNKMFMTLMLKKANIPTPKTYFSFTGDTASKLISEVGFPLVLKPVVGSWGRGIVLLNDIDAVDAVFEMRELVDGVYDRIFYLQEFIKRPPRDIRVITINHTPITAMYRESSEGFKTNLAIGAEPKLCQITPEIEEIASKASEAMGGGILGVDIMEDEKRGLLVHEVNNTTEFKGLAKVSPVNIPQKMIQYALDYLKR